MLSSRADLQFETLPQHPYLPTPSLQGHSHKVVLGTL